MSYYDIYKKRLNNYGTNAQQRLENGRIANFDRFLKQSPHYTTFTYGNAIVECVFEPNHQDMKQTTMNLLCRVSNHFNPGDIVHIANKDYMFWYWEQRRDSGYNKWTMIEISREISWNNGDGNTYTSKVYMYHTSNEKITNDLKSTSRAATQYLENNKLGLIIMPHNNNIKIGSYMEITVNSLTRYFIVSGFDFISTPGIMYVSIDPTLERDKSAVPTKKTTDDPNDFFWFGGNNLEGETNE